MSSNLRIPKEDIDELLRLYNFSKEDIKNILYEEMIKLNLSIIKNEKEFFKKSIQIAENLNRDDIQIKDLMKSIFELLYVFLSDDWSIDYFLKMLKLAIEREELLKPIQEDCDSFLNFLRKFLLNKSLQIFANSLFIKYDLSNLYIDSRIRANLKPIYVMEDKLGDLKIINNLRIKFTKSWNKKIDNIYITMFEEDLINLKEEIDKALKKNKKLQKLKEKMILNK